MKKIVLLLALLSVTACSPEVAPFDDAHIKDAYIKQMEGLNINPADIEIKNIDQKIIRNHSEDYKIILTSTNHKDHECHACFSMISAFVWKKENDKWHPIQTEYEFSNATQGGFAVPPTVTWLENNHGQVVLALGSEYVAQGYSAPGYDFYSLSDKGLTISAKQPDNIMEESLYSGADVGVSRDGNVQVTGHYLKDTDITYISYDLPVIHQEIQFSNPREYKLANSCAEGKKSTFDLMICNSEDLGRLEFKYAMKVIKDGIQRGDNQGAIQKSYDARMSKRSQKCPFDPFRNMGPAESKKLEKCLASFYATK